MNIPGVLLAAAINASSMVFTAGVAMAEAVPEPQRSGTITYVSGGVGEAEIAAMTRAAAKYPLGIVFVRDARPRDQYLAGVNVRLKDARGRAVLETVAEGPFLLADLPPGRYTVTAAHENNVKTRHVEIVSGKHRRVVLEWQS